MKITETQLKQLVAESLKKVLVESTDEWVESPYPMDDENNNGVDRVTPGDSLPMGCGNVKPRLNVFNPKYNSPKNLKFSQLRSTIVNTLRNYEQSKQSYKLADVAADLSKRYGFPYENVLSSIVKSYKFHDCHYADDEYEVMKESRNMKSTIKLKESDLRNIVKNAVIGVLNESMAADAAKRVIKEISINTLDNAERKSGGWDGYTRLYKDAGYGSRVHKAIDEIEEVLQYYAYKLENGQAKKLLTYLDPLRDFFNRKGKQAANFTDAREDERNAAEKELLAKAKEMFNKDIPELSDEEYLAVLSKCSPRTQEYAKVFW